MRYSCFLMLVLFFGTTPLLAGPYATSSLNNDPILASVLNAGGDNEGVEILEAKGFDFDKTAPGDEYVLLWRVIGPTYWETLVSIVSKHTGQWQLLARKNLSGSEVSAVEVKNTGLIRLNLKVPGPNDPLCCPSVLKELQLHYAAGLLMEQENKP